MKFNFDEQPFIVIREVTRARAYAMAGDYLGEEPLCVYQPRLAANRRGQETLGNGQFSSCAVPAQRG